MIYGIVRKTHGNILSSLDCSSANDNTSFVGTSKRFCEPILRGIRAMGLVTTGLHQPDHLLEAPADLTDVWHAHTHLQSPIAIG
jgi:hypothetical protein